MLVTSVRGYLPPHVHLKKCMQCDGKGGVGAFGPCNSKWNFSHKAHHAAWEIHYKTPCMACGGKGFNQAFDC